MIDYHRSCARNSILIRSPNFLSTASLNGICQDPSLRLTEKTVACYHHTFGEQKTYFYYLCQVGRKRADYFTSNFPHSSSDGVPVRMRLLKLARERMSLNVEKNTANVYCDEINQSSLDDILRSSKSIDDQMENLVNEMELKPAGIAMRFFVASLVEDIFCGLFPNSVCTPFGSSLNGFGKKGGDLDMHMEFEDPTLVRKRTLNRKLNVIYRSTGTTDDRQLNQKILDIYATVLSNFVPFCSDVRRILNARVPIIKFNIGFGGISCDLSANNTAHLCINNPVERHLIISKNVNLSEVQLFQDSCRRAKILLDDVINNGSSPPSSYVKKNSWGLLRLFELMAGYRNTKDLAGFYPNQAYPNDKNSSPSGKSIILNQILRGEFDELDKSIPKKIRQ
uniref:Poly(A) RNA polymerase mitochondrial-like central palm domain-containing protein n=1 Tax=Romanomermis culicivorax TaxID=13658 RepID=A0A915LAB5_ROMCU